MREVVVERGLRDDHGCNVAGFRRDDERIEGIGIDELMDALFGDAELRSDVIDGVTAEVAKRVWREDGLAKVPHPVAEGEGSACH